MKKNLSPYLIAASIIIGSAIISKAIISSSESTCFNVMYEEFHKTFESKNKMLIAKAAANVCK